MNITKLIDLLLDSVKLDIIDFQSVKMKDGKIGTRVVLDRILTETEKQQILLGGWYVIPQLLRIIPACG